MADEINFEVIYEHGPPGPSPIIGPNGNWFVNGIDQGSSATPRQVEFVLEGNDLYYRYVGDALLHSFFSLTIIGSAKLTEAERLSLINVVDGTKVYQTNKAKGEYQLVNGKWYFIGNKIRKTIVQVYSLLPEDIGYVLETTLDIPGVECTVTIPANVFVDGHTILLAQLGSSKIKFVAGNGMTIRMDAAAVNMRTYNRYTEAMIRFISATECIITGGLE